MHSGGMAIEVRSATRDDVQPVSGLLARAFDDDPLTTWLFPDPGRRAVVLPRFFRALFTPALLRGEVYTTQRLEGAAFWNPPGTFPLGWWTNAKVGWTVSRLLRLRVARCAPGLTYFDRHHPRQHHWYLQMLGTEPAQQGRGVGSALLVHVLERCDRHGERVYLEASKEENVPFYERHGFKVDEEMHVPRGPTMWAMWREPG